MKIRSVSVGMPQTLKRLDPNAGCPETWIPITRSWSCLGPFLQGLLTFINPEVE